MKKNVWVVLSWLLVSGGLQAVDAPVSEVGAPSAVSTPSLDEQLQALETPGNEAPAGITGEQLYAVQTRYVPLRRKHEFSLGGNHNFTSDSFLVSRSIDAGYRFFLNDRWYLSLAGSFIFNEFTPGAQRLIDEKSGFEVRPDVAVAKYRSDLLVGCNLFYGKFRFSMDQVFYFDQYVALGPGLVVLDTGNKVAAVADLGFSFWFGRQFSVRTGFKDYFFMEQRRLGSSMTHNILGYIQAGYLFGG